MTSSQSEHLDLRLCEKSLVFGRRRSLFRSFSISFAKDASEVDPVVVDERAHESLFSSAVISTALDQVAPH